MKTAKHISLSKSWNKNKLSSAIYDTMCFGFKNHYLFKTTNNKYSAPGMKLTNMLSLPGAFFIIFNIMALKKIFQAEMFSFLAKTNKPLHPSTLKNTGLGTRLRVKSVFYLSENEL